MKYKNVNRAENYWVFNARVLFALVQLEFLGFLQFHVFKRSSFYSRQF